MISVIGVNWAYWVNFGAFGLFFFVGIVEVTDSESDSPGAVWSGSVNSVEYLV